MTSAEFVPRSHRHGCPRPQFFTHLDKRLVTPLIFLGGMWVGWLASTYFHDVWKIPALEHRVQVEERH